MELSPHEEKMVNLQRQLQHNQQDLQDFLADLGNWEDEMKTKERELQKKSDKPETLPPVRNSLDKKKLKKKKKKKVDAENIPKKISGFDFRGWDKFDVDKALKDIDGDDKKSVSSEYETDEEWEVERKQHLANEQKNTGNSHLSAGAYDVAVECYTKGMELDPTNALLPANRALAFIKLNKYGAAEMDSTTAISLDPLYVKAYLRRAAARVGLQRLAAALEDYQTVLQLEPSNKQARGEVDRLTKELEREKVDARPAASSLETAQSSEVKAVYKPPEQRSKKPLRRIEIEEIGVKDDSERKAAIAKVEATQSSVKREMEAKDQLTFEKFVRKSSGDGSEEVDSDPKVNGDVHGSDKLPGHGEPDRTAGNTAVTQATPEPAASAQTVSQSEKSVRSGSQGGRSAGQQSSSTRNPRPGPSPVTMPSQKQTGASISGALDRDPPSTSFQFQADYRVLRTDLSAFYAYFKRIEAGQYSKLFGKSLEAGMLQTILQALRHCCILAQEDCFDMLKKLSEVQRFSTAIMFFSPKDKEGIREIFQFLKSLAVHPEKDISDLMKMYEV